MLKDNVMESTSMLKLAASAVILGSTIVGCSSSGRATRPGNASDGVVAMSPATAAAGVRKALANKDFDKAITMAEAAVGASPQDAGLRMTLGQAYLGAGRFASAETTFSDVLTLSPDHERAALNLALVQIALGKKDGALRTLTDYRDRIDASDYGLAAALAGDTREAVRVLEIAARSDSVTAKTRQNLALAYALDGQWRAAQVTAEQDLGPAEAGARIIQWAQYARPDGGRDQVAMLLGVLPVADSGQPARLALAPRDADVQTAMAEPVTAPEPQTVAIEAVAPVAVAAATVDEPVIFETVTAAKRPIVTAAAPVIRAPKMPAKQMIVPVAARPFAAGRFVVQLGAFQSAAVSKDAWKRVSARYGLARLDPANATAKVNGATYVRLSVGGFVTRAAASEVCTRIRSAGGNCFVRGLLGDAPVQWVQRAPVRAPVKLVPTKAIRVATR
jgi:Flp pilus assembly protein TadD